MCQSEICTMWRAKGSSTYPKAHTCKEKKAASWMNTMSCKSNRKAKICNEIGMLLSVWNVTEVLCFPFRSRNVNVCRVSDFWARNIYLPMWEAWITVLFCRSENISQKGRNRLGRSKKVSYKRWGFRHRYTRDCQGWQHCVIIPLAKHLAERRESLRRWKDVLSVDRERKKDGRRLDRFYVIICINAM